MIAYFGLCFYQRVVLSSVWQAFENYVTVYCYVLWVYSTVYNLSLSVFLPWRINVFNSDREQCDISLPMLFQTSRTIFSAFRDRSACTIIRYSWILARHRPTCAADHQCDQFQFSLSATACHWLLSAGCDASSSSLNHVVPDSHFVAIATSAASAAWLGH